MKIFIVVAVTIVITTMVAYCMAAIVTYYASFEQLELPTCYAIWNSAANSWNVTVQLMNSGPSDARLTNIFIDTIPLGNYPKGVVTLQYDGSSQPLSSISIPIPKGNSVTVCVIVQQNAASGFTVGTTIDLTMHSAAGQNYPASIKLT